jgi:hypothetical protein
MRRHQWYNAIILLPVFVNAYYCAGLKEIGETAYKEYGPVFRVWITVMPGVFLLAPEHIQVATSTI